jgi:hypothetical protein
VVTKALSLTLVPLTLAGMTQCGPSSGTNTGGDDNPFTGVCEVAFRETVGGAQHRYPELVHGTRFVFAKAIFTCDVPPESHDAVFELQTRRPGAGQAWRQVKYRTSSHVPRPKEAISDQGTCDAGVTAYWRIHVRVTGRGPKRGGESLPYTAEEFSREVAIDCPKKG